MWILNPSEAKGLGWVRFDSSGSWMTRGWCRQMGFFFFFAGCLSSRSGSGPSPTDNICFAMKHVRGACKLELLFFLCHVPPLPAWITWWLWQVTFSLVGAEIPALDFWVIGLWYLELFKSQPMVMNRNLVQFTWRNSRLDVRKTGLLIRIDCLHKSVQLLVYVCSPSACFITSYSLLL